MKLFRITSYTVKACFILLFLVAAISAQSFILSFTRGDDINEITLSCIDSLPVPDAQYFRNGVAFDAIVRAGERATFFANRKTEGNFSCGRIEGNTRTMGAPKSILALPDRSITPNTDPSYDRIGSTARLNCSIPPSQIFLNRYSVTWTNSSNRSDRFYQLSAGRPGVGKSPRYQLDSRTFALLIQNVQPLDAVTSYICTLSVSDIDTGTNFVFEETQTLQLRIVVFGPPAFTLIPSPVIISDRRSVNATFSCEVQSSPDPSLIMWFYTHRDTEVQIRESSQYHIENSTVASAGTMVTHSEVTVLMIDGFSSGEFRCEAHYIALISNKQVTLEKTSTSAALAVLSRPTNVETHSTENGGFIFKITLNDELPIPVAVQIYFQDEDSGSVMRSMLDEFFMNTRSITTYRESVPFTRFRVRIGVVHTSIRSPLLRDNEVHERSSGEREVLVYKTLSVCEAVVIMLLILIFLIVICAGVIERSLMNDDGHIAQRMLTRVNCKRKRNLMLATVRRKLTRNESDSSEDMDPSLAQPDGSLKGLTTNVHPTEYGITDDLATDYIEGLDMAIKFGKKDPKIQKLLPETMTVVSELKE